MKPKEHLDEGRAKFGEFKFNEVFLVRNWKRGVERWIHGRITQVKGSGTYLVRCENQIRFVHVDNLKIAPCIQSSSSWEGKKESNYAENLLSSQTEVRGGLRSPSEPLVSTSEAGGVADVGDVAEHERQPRRHNNHRWATLWRMSKFLRGTTLTAPSTEVHVPVLRKKNATQTHM